MHTTPQQFQTSILVVGIYALHKQCHTHSFRGSDYRCHFMRVHTILRAQGLKRNKSEPRTKDETQHKSNSSALTIYIDKHTVYSKFRQTHHKLYSRVFFSRYVFFFISSQCCVPTDNNKNIRISNGL